MNILIVSSCLLLFASVVSAQTRVPLAQGDLVYWEAAGPDPTSVASYVVHLYDKGVAVIPSLPVVGCTVILGVATTFTCRATLPSTVPPGDHDLTITALAPSASESAPSNLLLVTVTLPLSPQPHNLRTTPH